MDSHQRGHQYDNSTVSGSARAHFGDVYNTFNDPSQRETADARCRRVLFLADLAIDRQSLTDSKGERVEGTCEWILEDETYNAWLRDSPSLLWIRGGPGKGKTMLSIFLTHALEKRRRKDDVVYFFCSSLDENHSKATAILRSFIWQIISKRPDLTRLILPHFEEDERTQAVLNTFGTLWDMFADLLKQDELTPMYCVLDGLDECDDLSIRWLASKLATLSHNPRLNNMRVILVSRDMPELWHIKQKISLDSDNNDKVGADVETFTTSKMHELSQRLGLSGTFVEHIQVRLLEKSEATFLWIGYAVNELLTKETSSQVHEAIDGLPVELGPLYSRMLNSVPPDKADTVTSVLCWVLFAARPLSLLELADAIERHIPQHVDREHAARDCVKLCKPLITVQDKAVTLVHQSAKDYLLRQTEDSDPSLGKFRVRAVDAHMMLAETCLGKLGTESALAAYACSYWPEHARECGDMNERLLLTRHDHFFAESSRLRSRWWAKYIAQETYYKKWILHQMVADVPCLHMACYLGLKEWAETVLSSRSRLSKSRALKEAVLAGHDSADDWNGRLTPVNLAILAGRSNIVEYLLSQGIDPNEGESLARPLALAIHMHCGDEIMDLLLSHGGNNNLLLYYSISLSNLEMADLALKRGTAVNFRFWNGRTPLVEAVSTWKFRRNVGIPIDPARKIVRFLLQAGADPILRDKWGMTAIQYASEDMEEVKALMEEFKHQNDGGNPSLLERANWRIDSWMDSIVRKCS